MEAGSCFIKSTPTFTNKTPKFLYVIAPFEERMVKIVSDIFMPWNCFPGCLSDGEISPRHAVDGAVTSRATKPQQLEIGLYFFFMLAEKNPENTFISAYLLFGEFEKSQVLFSVVLL